jgi:phage shock protein C
MMRHDDHPEYSRGPYRARDGLIFGVCKGIARHLDFSVFWMRVIVAAVTVCTGIWPMLGLYLIAALIMKPEPVIPFQTEGDEEFYNSFTSSRQMAIHRLKRTYERLERRIRRMEAIVTDHEFDWDRRFNGGATD